MDRRDSFQSVSSNGSTSSRVSFCNDVSIKSIEPALEKDLAWYSSNELTDIRRDASIVVSAMRSKAILRDTETTCTHGLNSQVNKRRTKARKEDALFAVLEEQHYQLQESRNVVDQELIAEVYFHVTKGNQLSALRRGHKHAKDVQDMWTC
ncbi:unnamed protein product [Cylindrotheca closterium]|uniref:Uncharacterized protein n=1 Tax=Cylindrotheca closterium TaxID=2856 RepID=A0AAD2G5P0_9STRA|nr:unnamed protein product [Cylindrotheca closterium]